MKKIYIVAVSGGVDSVVLLHTLMSVKPDSVSYIVAHFDHGARVESADDAEFVASLARQYNLEFVSKRAELGEGVSEDTARDARYDFLFNTKERFKAEGIVVAHHQDDVLETMILNITRGTGPRGLIGFTRLGIVRPFMQRTKADILAYAKEQGLEWREDSTNDDDRYKRNYVRHTVLPKMTDADRIKLLTIRDEVTRTYVELDDLAGKLTVQLMEGGELSRGKFVTLPFLVQKEIWARILRLERIEIDRRMVENAVIATKTLQPGKRVELQKNTTLVANKKSMLLKVGANK